MASSGGAAEEAVKVMKEVVSIIEKKKRNLEKRKNKLEEYKVKQPENLNDDQRLALSKYDEVVASIDVLDEVYRLVSTHSKESCTQFEAMIEQERERRIFIEKDALNRSLSSFLCICNFANLPPTLQQSIACLNSEQISRLLAFYKNFLCSSNLPELNPSCMHNISMALLSLHHQDQSLLPKTHHKTSLSDINRSLQLLLDSSLNRLLQSFPSLPAQQIDAFLNEQQPTKANFNFLHSSSVLASTEESVVAETDTASKSQSVLAKEHRTPKPARPTNGHAKANRSAPRTNATKQSKPVPTPLMDLTPKTTLSLENSKVLAEASGIDLSDFINNNNSTSNAAPKTPKMPASSTATSKKWSPKDDLLDDEKPLSVSPSNSFSDSLPSAVGAEFTQNGNKVSHSQPLPNMGNIFDMILKNNPPVPDISQPSKLPYHRELPQLVSF
ncbi:hypothetical protein Ciccas_001150 [Cichlidogyrus casuarinus]|uniref:Uncharacterized protein n=1 Tax=Cichlidogyrus casuarinus TaxID=1844966 RepID=A0ABD2QM22_9PLAT